MRKGKKANGIEPDEIEGEKMLLLHLITIWPILMHNSRKRVFLLVLKSKLSRRILLLQI